jgi:DNA mismatch endonuclease, patch repair protein
LRLQTGAHVGVAERSCSTTTAGQAGRPHRTHRSPRGRDLTDIMSREQRSSVMARIRGANTLPELGLRRVLRQSGIRFRSNRQIAGISVDIVLPELSIAILVHGCFWHGCRLHYTPPTTNSSFWRAKLNANRNRDRRQVAILRRAGWRVAVVWEHSVLRDPRRVIRRFASIAREQPSPRPQRRRRAGEYCPAH